MASNSYNYWLFQNISANLEAFTKLMDAGSLLPVSPCL